MNITSDNNTIGFSNTGFSNTINTTTSSNNNNNNTIGFFDMYQGEIDLIPGLPNDIALDCLIKVPITSHPTLRLVSHNWNSTVSNPNFYSLRRNAATAENLVFLIQPLSPPPPPPPPQTQQLKVTTLPSESHNSQSPSSPLLYNLGIYNSTLQQWRSLGDVKIPTFAEVVAVPTLAKVVVLGGWDPVTFEPSTKVTVVDLVTGTWREGAEMPTARSFFAAAVHGGGVFVAGGHDGRKNALKTAEVYDVAADLWRRLPDMAEERDESHGLILGGGGGTESDKFWVVSGYGTESQGRFRSDSEVFDLGTHTWSRVDGVWPYPGHSPKSTAVVTAMNSSSRRQWLSVINGKAKEFDFEKGWVGLDLGRVPESVVGSTSISIVDMGEEGVMVMGNGKRGGVGLGGGCMEEGCGGEGVFIVVKVNEGEKVNWKWEHVHAPSRFLGFPFSTSHLFI